MLGHNKIQSIQSFKPRIHTCEKWLCVFYHQMSYLATLTPLGRLPFYVAFYKFILCLFSSISLYSARALYCGRGFAAGIAEKFRERIKLFAFTVSASFMSAMMRWKSSNLSSFSIREWAVHALLLSDRFKQTIWLRFWTGKLINSLDFFFSCTFVIKEKIVALYFLLAKKERAVQLIRALNCIVTRHVWVNIIRRAVKLIGTLHSWNTKPIATVIFCANGSKKVPLMWLKLCIFIPYEKSYNKSIIDTQTLVVDPNI